MRAYHIVYNQPLPNLTFLFLLPTSTKCDPFKNTLEVKALKNFGEFGKGDLIHQSFVANFRWSHEYNDWSADIELVS